MPFSLQESPFFILVDSCLPPGVILGVQVSPESSTLVEAAESMGFIALALTPVEAATSSELFEDTHFDPFDRMLIWQAIQRDMTLVSKDPEFTKFKADGFSLLWK